MVDETGNSSAAAGANDKGAQGQAELEARIAKDIQDRVGAQTRPPAIDADADLEARSIAIAKQRVIDYRITFGTEAGQRVLSDLRDFCLGDQDTFVADPHVSSYNQGRRRVYLRIDQSMRLDDSRIEALVRAQLEQQRGRE